MNLPFQAIDDESEIVPSIKLSGRVAGIFAAAGESFETAGCERLVLGFEGIEGDLHRGYERKAGAREPWYQRGTVMRNDRQISILATNELAAIANNMELDGIRPQWIGGNLLIEGVARLSMLPAGTLLMFAGGASIKVNGYNPPCRIAGAMLAKRAGMADSQMGGLAFAKAAKRLRGLVGSVEVPGTIRAGEDISIRVPEQSIYRV